MKGLAKCIAGTVLAALVSGCGFSMFEDVGTDPHPPELSILGLAFQPPTDKDGNTAPPVILPPTRITVRPNDTGANKILLRVAYRDLGADMTSVVLRDLDGTLNTSATPPAPRADLDGDGVLDELPAPPYFVGTSGEADLGEILIEATMEGDHRIEVWAVDSHDSRSAKANFILTIEL